MKKVEVQSCFSKGQGLVYSQNLKNSVMCLCATSTITPVMLYLQMLQYVENLYREQL